MASKKSSFIFLIGFSVLFTYAGILYFYYDEFPHTITTHLNYNGEANGFGRRNQLWIASGVNLLLLLILCMVHNNYHKWYKPESDQAIEKTEKIINTNKLVLSILSIVVSISFSTMIFYTLKFSAINVILLLGSIIVLPLVVIFLIKKK